MSTIEDATAGPGETRHPDVSLAQVTAATTELRRARSLAADAEDEWRFTVESALEGREPVEQVADAAGITVDQVQELHGQDD